MKSDFLIHTHTTGRAVTLVLSGDLDLVSGPALERALDDCARTDIELILVDLRAVEFMDSTGLHVLLNAQQQAHDSGRRFALIRGSDQVQRLFDLTGVADGLTIVDSPDDLLQVDQAPGSS